MTTSISQENTPPPTDLMAALRASLDQAKQEREQRQITLAHIAEVPAYSRWAWPNFNPEYRVARCGDAASHSPHVMEHGPDRPRNCPGTGEWVECSHCTQLVPAISADVPARHQVDGQWCKPAEVA